MADGTLTILTGAYPYRLYEVAPYITLVSIGAQFTGAVSANLRFWQSLSAEEQQSLKRIAKGYSERTSRIALARYDEALEAMQAAGASVSRLPDAERRQWIDSLEPLAKQWVERYEQKNLPAKRVLSGLMNGLRARGVQPMQDWDEHLD